MKKKKPDYISPEHHVESIDPFTGKKKIKHWHLEYTAPKKEKWL